MRELAKKMDPKSAMIATAATAAICFTTCEIGNLATLVTGGDTSSCVASTVSNAIPSVLAISLLSAVADPQKAMEVTISAGMIAHGVIQQIRETPTVQNAMGRVNGLFQKKKAADTTSSKKTDAPAVLQK